VKAATEMANE